MRTRLLALTASLAACLCAPPAYARPLPSLVTGFTDPILESPSPGVREAWLGRVVGEHAAVVRINVAWATVARAQPPSPALAADPSWAGYDWSTTDVAVADAVAHGLTVQLTLASPAPAWEEGPHRPSSAPRGSWEPNPGAFASFARAAALRYSGTYTPPGATAALPRVRYWQAWNEPNLSIYLTPQWRKVGRGWAPESPFVYRDLLNAFYAAVKAVQPDALVLSAGTAPYGDPPGGERMPPAQFVRNVLCLGEALQPEPCPHPALFDILDHHPYSVSGPFFRAFNRDDVAIADMPKLIVPLRRAERLHLVGGARHHQVWVTEVSWDSSPPDPQGVPIAEQARWLEQTLHLLWQQGVSTVLWYLIADQPPIPSYAASYQSGTYYIDGRPKPSATAFRFPFVVDRVLGRAGGSRSLAWGRAPVAGARVTIEQRLHGAWRVLRTLSSGSSGVFQASLRVGRGAVLRALDGSEQSLVWRVE